MKIGFIWQWFIGWNMANDFEQRGFEVIRYDLEKYKDNQELIKEADIVFVAVPTPSIKRKFCDTILAEALKNTVAGQKIVIKSTVIPWTTNKFQKQYPDRYFFHSAEFLTEKNAIQDTKTPSRNIVGFTDESVKFREDIMKVLPKSNEIYCKAIESELWKYFSNFLLTGKVIMANLLYDICERDWISYDVLKSIAWLDPRIWPSHLDINMDWGRWAGGHCFVKDLSALHEYYNQSNIIDIYWHTLLEAMEVYNYKTLKKTWKSLPIINQVYWND